MVVAIVIYLYLLCLFKHMISAGLLVVVHCRDWNYALSIHNYNTA